MPYSPPQHRPAYAPSREQVRKQGQKDYNRTKRKNQEFYDSTAWRKLSRLYRRLNPLCVDCKAKGIAKAVQIVDHVIPIEQGGERLAMSNLQSLCIACHNTKTAGERVGAGQKSIK